MVAAKKTDLKAMRQRFLELGWSIVMKYLEHLDDEELLAATDARAGAGVVKMLFDSMDKAEAGQPPEEEVELPEISEKILEQILAEALGEDAVERTRGQAGRSAPPRIPFQQCPEC